MSSDDVMGDGFREADALRIVPPDSPLSELLASAADKEALIRDYIAVRWRRKWIYIKDPELLKVLAIIADRLRRLQQFVGVSEATGRLREAPPSPHRIWSLRVLVGEIDLRPVKRRPSRRQGRSTLQRDAAWELADALTIELLWWATDEHLSSQLELEATLCQETPPSTLTWDQRFPLDELQLLRRAFRGPGTEGSPRLRQIDAGTRRLTIDRLATLYRERIDEPRHDRARSALRVAFLLLLVPILSIVLLLVASTLVINEDWWSAATAGALGSALSGTYRMRDEIGRISDMRRFLPMMVLQPLLGGVAALLIYWVLSTGVIQVGNLMSEDLEPGHYAIFGFLAGFSEPYFLGTVQRLGGLVGK